MSKGFSTKKRIRRKRNFLIHLFIYLSIGVFFFMLNVFTMGRGEDWWFIFPMLPLGLILSIHFIFSIGKDYTEIIAARWEAHEQGRSLDEYIDFIEDEMVHKQPEESFELDQYYKSKLFLKRRLDEDFV